MTTTTIRKTTTTTTITKNDNDNHGNNDNNRPSPRSPQLAGHCSPLSDFKIKAAHKKHVLNEIHKHPIWTAVTQKKIIRYSSGFFQKQSNIGRQGI